MGLQKTGDTFLLGHNSVSGRDMTWSDNHDGTGTNWLGLLLMLIRDKLNASQKWTSFVRTLIDLSSGKPISQSGQQKWQDVVLAANKATMKRLGADRTIVSQGADEASSKNVLEKSLEDKEPEPAF